MLDVWSKLFCGDLSSNNQALLYGIKLIKSNLGDNSALWLVIVRRILGEESDRVRKVELI